MNSSPGLTSNAVRDTGHCFLRLHVIDMAGPMDIEVGVITEHPQPGDARIRTGELPAGHYATMAYRLHDRRANKFLLDWMATQGLTVDREDRPEGDAFAARYEAYPTDPRTEPRKTQRVTELNMKVLPPVTGGWHD